MLVKGDDVPKERAVPLFFWFCLRPITLDSNPDLYFCHLKILDVENG